MDSSGDLSLSTVMLKRTIVTIMIQNTCPWSFSCEISFPKRTNSHQYVTKLSLLDIRQMWIHTFIKCLSRNMLRMCCFSVYMLFHRHLSNARALSEQICRENTKKLIVMHYKSLFYDMYLCFGHIQYVTQLCWWRMIMHSDSVLNIILHNCADSVQKTHTQNVLCLILDMMHTGREVNWSEDSCVWNTAHE